MQQEQGRRVTGGIDTAHVSLWVEWTEKTPEMVEQIQQAQEYARRQDTEDDGGDLPALWVGEQIVEVHPYGFNPDRSGGGQRCYFHYSLKVSGIRIGISERIIKSEKSPPNMRVEIGSLALMQRGLRECWRIALEVVEGLGGIVMRDAPGRLDPCVDLPNVKVSSLQKSVWDGNVVSKCKCKTSYNTVECETSGQIVLSQHGFGRKDTGVTLGRGDISCRMYDKARECRNDEAKLYELVCSRWGGVVPEEATRVEFQLRRDALRELHIFTPDGVIEGIQTMADWFAYEHQVVMYLCTSWLRVYAASFDARHTERLTIEDMHPDWLQVVEAFDAWTNPAHQQQAAPVRRIEKPLRTACANLVRNGFGSLRSALAKCGHVIDTTLPDWSEKFATLCAQMIQHQANHDGKHRFDTRQNRTFMRLFVNGEYDNPAVIGLFGLSQ